MNAGNYPMRRERPVPRPATVFSGPERWRLMTGVLMLIVLAMLIARTGDPRNWRWLAAAKTPEPRAAAPTLKVPEPTGPTDEDPEQAEAAREEFQAVTDGGLQIGKEGMFAYNRFVAWANNQSFARLWQRARKDVWYTDLYDAPRKHRGQLVALDLEIGRAKSVGPSDDGTPLHEVWGATEESRGRLYDLIVVGYPKDMPTGADVRREYGKVRARFAGYFLKLQDYESGLAKPGQRPERAPVLIGRIEWTPEAVPAVDNSQEYVWAAVLLAVVGLGLIAWFFFGPKREGRPAPPPVVATSTGEPMPIDEWLERRNFVDDDAADDPRDGA
jgi:hypothetical protein